MMFGFVLFAACRPAHDDWLNDLSSTPPVSSTMQAVNGAVAAELLDAGAEDELAALLVVAGGALLLDPPDLALLPHAVSTMAPIARVTVAIIVARDMRKTHLPLIVRLTLSFVDAGRP
jgi:hypothetical protein